MAPKRISVLIADDHPPQRAGVRAALEEGGFTVVAEAADADGAVASALEHTPAICLLDINMPGSGIRAAERISRLIPSSLIVMLTVSQDDEDLIRALQAGAEGYLLKDIQPQRLPLALHSVVAGEAVLPRTLVARMADEFAGRGRRRTSLSRGPRVNLTSKEWEVLEHMRQGRPTAEIAGEMYVSSATVRSHVSSILRKLRVKTREEAVRLTEE